MTAGEHSGNGEQAPGNGGRTVECMAQVFEAGEREMATPPGLDESARTDDAKFQGTRTKTNVGLGRMPIPRCDAANSGRGPEGLSHQRTSGSGGLGNQSARTFLTPRAPHAR